MQVSDHIYSGRANGEEKKRGYVLDIFVSFLHEFHPFCNYRLKEIIFVYIVLMPENCR